MAPRGAAGPASPSPPQTQLEGERKGVGISGPPARSSAPRSATPTPAPGRTTSAAPKPREGRSGLSLAPVSLPCDQGRPLSPQHDSHGGRGPSVSGPASPLSRTPATPAAPRGGGRARSPPGPSPYHPRPGTPEKRLPGARVGREHGPDEEKEKEDGGLRPREIWEIWETCSALGDSCSLRTRTRLQTPIPQRSSPSRGEDARQRRRRVHSASRLPPREGARAVT